MQDHRPVSFHQGRESRLGRLSPGAKLLKQLPIRPITQRPDPEESVNVAEDRNLMGVWHGSAPLDSSCP
jgi:hypothetical protein